MSQPQHFTFSEESIERYDDECDNREIHTLATDISNTLNNFEDKHLDIITDNMDENLNIRWIHICKYDVLDDQFIYNYHKKLHWPHLVKYQILSRAIIKHFAEEINKNDLWESLIKYQKLPGCVINDLYGNIKYWRSLVIYQKLGQTTMCRMVKHMKMNYIEDSIEFNKLIIKHQLSNEDKLKIII